MGEAARKLSATERFIKEFPYCCFCGGEQPAYMWFNLAAAGGDKDAVTSRDRIAAQMTPAQVTKAQKLAHEWKPTSTPTLGSAPMSKLLGQNALPPARNDMIAR